MASPETKASLRSLIERALPCSHAETAQFLVEAARKRTVAADDTIFRQGEIMPLVLIVSGYAAFRRTTVDGHQLVFGIVNSGFLFGFSAISSLVANVDVLALTECEVATWYGPDLRRLVGADPGFALDAINQQSRFLSAVTEKVEAFLHQDARRRVVRVLLQNRDLFHGDPPVLSRSQLPALVGTSREMTGRVLRQLEREGLVARVGRSGLKLLKPERLDAAAAPGAVRRR